MSARYAIYFAPHQDSLLWRLGCLAHGRDPASGATFEAPVPDGLARIRYDEIVSSARHYGFHATLKPPFELAPGKRVSSLQVNLAAFADAQVRFVAPALEVARVGGFLALTLGGGSREMDRLSSDCVAQFDSYRAPASKEELTARRRPGLSPRQDELLVRWGYPYVMAEWNFHMTLTTWLQEPEISILEGHLRLMFRPVMALPLFVDRIALFAQKDRNAAFKLEAWFPFGR